MLQQNGITTPINESRLSSIIVKSEGGDSDKYSNSTKFEDDRSKRFNFLMKQTEIFSLHFKAKKQGAHNKISSKITMSNSLTQECRKGSSGIRSTNQLENSKKSTDDEVVNEYNKVEWFKTSPPYIMNGELKDYQIEGLNWMISLHENGINGILADEMGLGKTIQAIALLGYLKHFEENKGPHLVIAPKSTIQIWLDECEKWCPSLRVFALVGSKAERASIIRRIQIQQIWNVCITSYETCYSEKPFFNKLNWKYIIIDEAHRTKRERAPLLAFLRSCKSINRLLLTGIPIQNNVHEIRTMLNFLLPDVDLDSKYKIKEFVDDKSVVEHLNSILKPFILRRMKSDVLPELKPKKEVKIFAPLTKMQREWYMKILLKDFAIINGANKIDKQRLQSILTQLKKVSNHPYFFKGAEPEPFTTDEHLVYNSGKMIVLDKLLKQLKLTGSRVLIFTQFKEMLDILEDYCTWQNHKYCRIDGNTPYNERTSQIEEFNDDETDKFIFILSTKTGSVGINLTAADVVILYDSDWNPQIDIQAIDRAHRIGQKQQVRIFRLITAKTIEEKLLERTNHQSQQNILVINRGKFQPMQPYQIGTSELLKIIRSGLKDTLTTNNIEITDKDINNILHVGLDNCNDLGVNVAAENDSTFCYRFECKTDQNDLDDSDSWKCINLSQNRITIENPFPTKYIIPEDFQFFPEKLKDLLDQELCYFRKTLNYEVPLDPKLGLNAERIKRIEQRKIDKAQPLTSYELAEKEVLLTKSFIQWKRSHFNSFINAIKRYGRDDIMNISKDVLGKTPEEVIEYNAVFWERFNEIHDIKNILPQINHNKDGSKDNQKNCQQKDAEGYDIFNLVQTTKVDQNVVEPIKKVERTRGGEELREDSSHDITEKIIKDNPKRKHLCTRKRSLKKLLKKKAFTKWTKNDCNNFTKAVKKYGRDDLESICRNVKGKEPTEVKRYYTDYWRKAEGQQEANEKIKYKEKEKKENKIKKKIMKKTSNIEASKKNGQLTLKLRRYCNTLISLISREKDLETLDRSMKRIIQAGQKRKREILGINMKRLCG